jgi:DNA ligase-1
MLAHKYKGQDPVGMFISEKLDGYRAVFSSKGFMSRNNKPFNAPERYLKEISDALPPGTVLDGELYTKRGDFAGMGVVRKNIPVESEWSKITYMVFDLPTVRAPFEKRYEMMKKMLQNVPHVKVVECKKITSLAQFNDEHKSLVAKGAEGTMLRNPDSYYEHGRSNNLLKVKDSFDDEVIVEDMEFGEGRNDQVMGNLIVKWHPNAKQKYKGTFEVGSGFTDDERKNWKKLYKKGTVLTIKYWEIQKPSGKPRFPVAYRIRHPE